MPVLVYAESPLNPLRIMRYLSNVGLAFEKHRWLFESVDEQGTLVNLFTFGYQPLREIYIPETNALGEPIEAIPLAQSLAPDALPTPPLHFTLVFEPEAKVPQIVESLVINWQAPIHLVFSQAMIPPFNQPPRQVIALIENILGHEWDGDQNPGWVPLLDGQVRQRALRALGTKGFHSLYLVAGSTVPTALPLNTHELFEKRNGLTKVEEPEIDYRLFHALLSDCDWILTSHGNVPDVTPFCFYSTQNLQTVFQKLLPTASQALVEFDDINNLNQAAGITVKPRDGLALSEIMPLEMLTGITELSLAWSDLARLDELPTLSALRHLDLDGTLIDDLRPLNQMLQLESLSLRYLQLTDLQPLTTLPSLQKIALSRIPFYGLSHLAAMPALTSLNLDLVQIDNASLLTGCQQLKDISLNRTPLKQLDEIAQLRSLERLSICSTAVTNITPLTALPNLNELLMDGCDLEDFSPIAEIGKLTTFHMVGLDAPQLPLPDLSPLAAMQGLKKLYLYNTTFAVMPSGSLAGTLEKLDISATLTNELSWLTNLELLRDLEIAHIEAPDLSPLAAMSSLEALNVAGCKVGDLVWLTNLNQLRTLNLNLTEIYNFQPIANLSSLRSLSLGGAYINSPNDQSDYELDILCGIDKLEELNISGWEIGAFTGLANLKHLRLLDLSYTDIKDTALLREITQLTDLDLSETPTHSLNGLINMLHLRRLNLNNTSVENLSPISLATELEELSLRNTAINNLEVLGGFNKLKKLDLRGIPNRDCDFSPLLELPRLRLLRLESHGINYDVLTALMRRHRVVIRPT